MFKHVSKAIDFVGNVSSEDQTSLMSRMLENGIISKLASLLKGEDSEIAKSACWIICNIAAEDDEELCATNIHRILETDAVITIA